MGDRFRRLPSPAMAVAFIALLAALGGTAVALPGKSGVKKDDIARGAVNTTDIANNTIRGRDVRTSTLRGSDVGANTLSGSDINEGSLGTVPNATNATNAANATNAGTLDGKDSTEFGPRAFFRINPGGTIDTARSQGIGGMTVTHVANSGLYCFFGLPFTPRSINATVDWVGGGSDAVIHGTVEETGSCTGSEQASARIIDPSTDPNGTTVDRAFYVKLD